MFLLLFINNLCYPGLNIYTSDNKMKQIKKNHKQKLVKIKTSWLLLKYIG